MDRFIALIGIFLVFLTSFILSNNRRKINYRIIISGLILQFSVAFFILKTAIGAKIFKSIGDFLRIVIDDCARYGAEFVFGPLVRKDVLSKSFGNSYSFIFFFNIMSTIVLICVIVNLLYYFGIMQKVVSCIAKFVHKFMGISGSEAISNVASVFVGQVEAQIMIKPYLDGMTKSELLASMSGSMACISGGVMVVYIGFGIPSEYLLAASLMSAPGALVISKIIYPETEQSETTGTVKLSVDKKSFSALNAITQGCKEGLDISLNLTVMLIGFMSLVSLVNVFFCWIGRFIGVDNMTLQYILGKIFAFFAWSIGVPSKDIEVAGSLLGTKLVVNEFIAYLDLQKLIMHKSLDKTTVMLLSIALCGFANFGSVGVQVGGIGEIAPKRIKDLSKLGGYALICGTLSSYLSAAIVRLIM